MEAWKDELYHYGVRGMKWKHHTDSGMSQDESTVKWGRRTSNNDAAIAARSRYEARKLASQKGDPSRIRALKTTAKRFSDVSRYERDLANKAEDRIHKKRKNRKNEGRSIRSRGSTYVRRVLS